MKVWERVVTTAPERPRLSTHHKGRGSVPGVLRAARLPRVGSTVVSDCVWFRQSVFTLLNKADAALEALSRGSCGPRAGLPGSRAIRETDVQLFINHRRNPDGDRCFLLGPVNKISRLSGTKNVSKDALVREACLNKSEVPGVFLGLNGRARAHRYSLP